jgi:DNA (cytosine-5)-methyltransferase 1
MKPIRLFNIYGFTGGSFAGNVYDVMGAAPALNTMGGGNREPIILENMEEKDFNRMTREQQKLMLVPPELKGKKFRIRKLTPRECFRLMGLQDDEIDSIQSANISNSQMYHMAGNSIVVNVLDGIFENMFYPPKVREINLF